MTASVPPAGSTPASAYSLTVTQPQEPPPAILADPIGIDGEWTDLLTSASIADGMAREAMAIERATGAAVRDLGQRFRFLSHVDDQSDEVLETMAREAFRPAVEAGVLSLERVYSEVDPSDGTQLNAVVEYRDLLAPPSAASRRIEFPLGTT
jgi:hypothetical protein